MLKKIENIIQEINQLTCRDAFELDLLRVKYLGKKGLMNSFFEEFKKLPNDEKRLIGKQLNELKRIVTEKIGLLKKEYSNTEANKKYDDLFKNYRPIEIGSRHPLTLVENRIIKVFLEIGFSLSEGPEIENDWYNFTALNLPQHHPARDMQDTFFIEQNPDILLRTHTSSVQIRHMEANKPPIRTISPGRVFRNEAISSRSHCLFHQVEGIYVDENVSFSDLKQTIYYFIKRLFGDFKIRFRPSYFPFTEPSAEVDIYWGLKNEIDHRITKGTGWLEIIGCGLVSDNVLKNCDINPKEYSGYAFGMGIERMAMLMYQISDIRLFYENDVRFLEQFKSEI